MRKWWIILVSTLFVVLLFSCFVILNNKNLVVTYDSNGTVIEVIVKKNTVLKRPKDPVKEGYKFIGWMLDDKEYDFSSKVTKDITLVANFKKDDEETIYTIKFNTDSNNIVKDIKVKDGKITNLPTPTKEGYEFIGWFNNEDEIKVGDTIKENITLTAKWKKNETTTPTNPSGAKYYTVSFNTDGGSKVSSQMVKANNKAKKPADPVKEGYKFLGWYLGNNVYSFNLIVTSNITLVAKWEKINNESAAIITYQIEDVPGSIVGQAKVFVLKNGVKTDGYADITTSKGTQTVVIPKDGLSINKNKIEKIENARLEK